MQKIIINSNGVRSQQRGTFGLFTVYAMNALQARKNGAIGGRGERLDDRDIARGFNAF